MAKITIKELESLSLSVGRAELRIRPRRLAAQIPDKHPQARNQAPALTYEQINPNEHNKTAKE